MLAVALLVLLVWARALWIVLRDRRAVPRLGGRFETPGPGAPFVSIVVPARNEAHNIERCVSSLLGQQWPRFEVIAVDDSSEDGTGAILARLAAADARLVVVKGTPLPDGWLGKVHACALGAARARGELILFTDADTVHQPQCLAHAVPALHQLGADLLTLVPHIECVGLAEKLLQPAILGGLFTVQSFTEINRDAARIPIATGQFLLFRRAAYEAIGGHAAVRGRVIDDVALGKRVVDAGLKLRIAWAPDLFRARMYTRWSEIWWGYAKSMAASPALFLGLEGTPLRRAAAIFMMAANSSLTLFVGLAPPALLAAGGWVSVLAAGAIACAVAQRVIQNLDHFRIGPLWALTLPIGHVVSASINAHSAWRAISASGPRWKGREYPWAT